MHRNLAQLARNVYDVLVIGGGIYGVCVAWDATLRGLSVALLEKGDFGHATSSNTLRIIHGGFRYLQHGDIRRMRQSIYERKVFMRIAPHLVHPLPFLIPTYGHGMRGKEVLTLALRINDLIGFDRNRLQDPQKYLPRGRIISREECLRLVPGLEKRGLTGGAICYDGQIANSERLILAIARSAARRGADLANYVEVTGLLAAGHRVAGVTARDVLTGDALDVQARLVVNTSGPWFDRVLGLLNGGHPKRTLRLSKAFNILVKRQLIPRYAVGVYGQGCFNDRDAILNKGSRLFFITPWHGRSLIGTAHLPYDADPDNLSVSEAEIQAFLDEINAAYPVADLKRQDVCFAYGGLLPAVSYGAGDVQLTKRHRIHDHRMEAGLEGLISVTGVKFTEARHVAEKVVDLVFKKLGKTPPQSPTAITPVYGGQVEGFAAFVSQETQSRPRGLSADVTRDLICRYGVEYPRVLQYLAPSSPDNAPIASLLAAEVLHGVHEEMAQKVTDVVFRRTALGMAGSPGDACLKSCAALMAQAHGWNAERMQKEVEEARVVFASRT
jgi:glycerol-3-phosphate dehydrogenase